MWTDAGLSPHHSLTAGSKARARAGQFPADARLRLTCIFYCFDQRFQRRVIRLHATPFSMTVNFTSSPFSAQYASTFDFRPSTSSCGIARISTPSTPSPAVTLYTPGVPTLINGNLACDCQPSADLSVRCFANSSFKEIRAAISLSLKVRRCQPRRYEPGLRRSHRSASRRGFRYNLTKDFIAFSPAAMFARNE